MVPEKARIRALHSWFVECPEEQPWGYFYALGHAGKPHLAPATEYGGLAHSALTYAFVEYTAGCLQRFYRPTGTPLPSLHSRPASDGALQRDSPSPPPLGSAVSRGRLGEGRHPVGEEDAYCSVSLPRMLRYMETAVNADEVFVQTALFNGPFCNAAKAYGE